MTGKKTAITIALILILTFTLATSMMVLPGNALFADTWPTWLLLSVGPNPVGKDQTVTVNMIMANPTPTARGALGDRYEDVTYKVVRPDGTAETFGPFMLDPTGGGYATYTPSQTGNYTFQAFYPGQTCNGQNPSYPGTVAWGYGTAEMWNGTKLLPDESEIITLNVQEDPIEPFYHTPPLPTEYWTRSITAQNWEWGRIAGNWYNMDTEWNGNYSANNVQYYSQAPNSPHILWTKMTHFGGVVGNPTDSDQESQYMLTSMIISYINDNPSTLNGIYYYNDYIGASQTFSGATGDVGQWHAIDIRTGEQLWQRKAGETGTELISFTLPLSWHSIQEFGAWGYLVTSSGSSMRIYDARSGAYLANITGVTGGGVDFLDFDDPRTQGTAMNYYTTSNQSGVFLNKWNMTQVLAYRNGFPSSGVQASTIRVSGNYNFSRGLEYPGGWTKQIDTTLQGQNTSMSVSIETPEVVMLRRMDNPTDYVSASAGWQVTAGYSAITGDKLWGPFNQSLPYLENLSVRCNDDNVYVIDSKTTARAWGYSIKTGQQLWGPVQMVRNAFSHLSRTGQCAYGKAYISDFGGYVNCIDLATGNLDWTFTRGSAGYDTPFGVYPQWYWSECAAADGKLYIKEGHEYNPPQFPGRLLAINATDGTLVWSILFCGPKAQVVVSDGIAVDWNSNDGNIYAFGKGPTKTTVSIANPVTTFGHKVLVNGMVTDVSAGTQQSNILPRFPNGVPAVSDESQREWMEYVYMQQIKPAATGVDVVISVSDPNGNTYDVGTAKGNGDGFYTMDFDPEVPGRYVVTARFAGSESYWGSFAQTSLFVEQSPAASPTPTPPPAAMTDTYVTGFGIGIIIAIVVVGLLLFLLFRKR